MDSKSFAFNKVCEKDYLRDLFVFPYAGGGVSVFRAWQESFKDTRVIVAQYPGRENRIQEEPFNEIALLLLSLFEEIKEFICEERDYYLFGHSFGSKVVYELTLLIKKNNLKLPKGIIVSGGRAPYFKEQNPIYNLDDNNFIRELSRYSGTPKEVLENRELMSIFLPMLRADFIMDETYSDELKERIDSPILGLTGRQDLEMTLEELLGWEIYTNKEFTYDIINGKHLFINTNTQEVIDLIVKFMDRNSD